MTQSAHEDQFIAADQATGCSGSADPTQERTGHTAAEQEAYWRGFEQAQLNAQHNASLRPIPASTVATEGEKDWQEPEILPYAVQRILAFAGKHQSQCTAPHLSAQQAIDLAAWIQANCRPAPAAGDAPMLEFVREVAQQKPEKPDHWSSCGQCERNTSTAEELLEAHSAIAQQSQRKEA